jgi:hypothetical protein
MNLQQFVYIEKRNLKPCPFCGEVVRIGVYDIGNDFTVECSNCRGIGPKGKSIEQAKILWNRRFSIKQNKETIKII